MSLLRISFPVLLLFFLSGCASSEPRQDTAVGVAQDTNRKLEVRGALDPSEFKQISLQEQEKIEGTEQVIDRKIIRNAELAIEVESTSQSQQRITSISESHGGFVVTSEVRQRRSSDPNRRELEATVVVRVPAPRFEAALNEIRALGVHVIHEKASAQDVTEEFIDLEARIRAKKALEAQILEIMKRATKIPEALEVQRELAEVRAEIEKIEGRKRFLENQSNLSTIKVTLQPPTAFVVSTTGFGKELKEAVSDSINMATALVFFLVRFVIVMIPVFLLIILPLAFLVRYALRRFRRLKLARQLQTAPPSNYEETI